MKKLNNIEVKLKKGGTYKKVCNSFIILIHNLNFIIEILWKCIFHSTVLNQPPVHSILWKYST